LRAAALVPCVLIVAAALVTPTATGEAQAAWPLTWKVEPTPFRLTVYQGSHVLLRQHNGPAGPGTRLSYRIRQGSVMESLTNLLATAPTPQGAVYTVATTEPGRIATVRVSRTPRGLHVDLDLGTASTAVRTVYEAFESPPGEHFLGTGERRDMVDLKGRIVPIKAWAPCGSGKPAPFYASSRGYGVQFNETAVGRMAFGSVGPMELCSLGTLPCEIAPVVSVIQLCLKTIGLSYEIYPGTPEQVVQAYAASTGRPPLPTPDQFGLVKWRDSVVGERDLIEDADRFARAGIPLRWLLIDNPWETGGCLGKLSWDATRFPEPSAMLRRLHSRNLKVMLWVSPMVKTGCGQGLYPVERLMGPGAFQAIDLTDPLAAATFEERLAGVLALDVDGLKVDRGDEVDFELRPVAAGSGDELHNQYPLLLAQSVARASITARGSLLPTLFRAGFSGAQRYTTGVWAGDLSGSWDGIAGAVRSAQTAGVAGYSTWGSDVGGYFSEGLTTDVFMRWAQLGAISPVFEVGGVGPNAAPWKLGAAAMAALRSAAILHYELFPYHYELARRAHATGVSILRPVALEYPHDPGSWQADRELLVGPDLLAAPVTHPGSFADIYLPPGRWVDLGNGARLAGPATLRRPTPLDELPLYLREGAAIPYNRREPDVWQARWQLNDLFRGGRGGWLVAAGSKGASGTSVDYGAIEVSTKGATTRLQVSRARRETQVVLLGKQIPTKVTIDGRAVARARSAPELRRQPRGWAVRGGAPFAGLVLKLAPRAGRSLVTIEY
jgi:alpha-D-xyloside xylohydrolase